MADSVVSLSYMRIPVISCDWPGCEAVNDGEPGENADDARACTSHLGWCNDGCGHDYCPEHRALSGEVPR